MILYIKKNKKGGKLSKNSYYRDLLFWWIYTPLWFFAFYAIYELWDTSWLFKIFPYIVLLIVTPDPRPLFRSYSAYKKDVGEWLNPDEKIDE
jgi:hypothetical protein